MEYRLKIDGDPIEKESWDLFVQTKFSNYEIFWQKFVVPRTNRPDNLYLKQEFLSEEHENEAALITQIHYSILVHFYYIYKNINRCDDDFIFDNLITRLSSITDLTEEFLFRYLIYFKKIDITELVKNFENSKKLEVCIKDATKNLKNGMNYSIPIFKKEKILLEKFKTENVKKLFKLINEIRSYRNKVVHSWVIFKINNKVPNREFLINPSLQKYQIWSNLYNVINYNSETPEAEEIINNYIDKRELVFYYYNELLNKINLVWKDLLEIK